MELKDFIEQSVSDIIEATQSLKTKHNSSYSNKNPIAPDFAQNLNTSAHKIDFDIAITTSETNNEKSGGKIGIKVLNAGIGKEDSCMTENASRIQFSIPFYPEYIDTKKNKD